MVGLAQAGLQTGTLTTALAAQRRRVILVVEQGMGLGAEMDIAIRIMVTMGQRIGLVAVVAVPVRSVLMRLWVQAATGVLVNLIVFLVHRLITRAGAEGAEITREREQAGGGG